MGIRVTRKDVAKLAGVSPSVVSYVINNSNYVSMEKREAVLNAIKELGYSPNLIARSMRTKKSYHFAIVADDIRNELFAEFLYYMEMYSFEKGYNVTLCSSRHDDEFISSLIGRGFDGVFMTSNAFTSKQLNQIVQREIPLVLFKTRSYNNLDPRIVTLSINFSKSITLAMDHLYKLGHRRIAYFPPYKYKTYGIHDKEFRLRSYIKFLSEHDLPLDKELVCQNVGSYEEGCKYALNLLRPQKDVTAFIISNDVFAAIIMRYLKKNNISIPDDISIIGMDNTNSSVITTPEITTISTSKKKFSMEIVDVLIRLINKEKVEDKYFDVDIIIRETTKSLDIKLGNK